MSLKVLLHMLMKRLLKTPTKNLLHIHYTYTYILKMSTDGFERDIKTISKIRPYLFLSGTLYLSKNRLRKLGITHAVDVSSILKAYGDIVEYLFINVRDTEFADIMQHFENVGEFIKSARESVTIVYKIFLSFRIATIKFSFIA